MRRTTPVASFEDLRRAAKAERDRALEIIAACKFGNRSDLTCGYIASGLTPAAVRQALSKIEPPKRTASMSFDPAVIERELAASRTIQ